MLPGQLWRQSAPEEGLGPDGHRRRLVDAAQVAHDVLDQQRQIGLAVAQRRQLHLDDREAVVEIRAELVRADLLAQAAVGRGDDAHVDRHVVVGADAADLAALEHAQQLGLQVEAQLADLVEEDRAAVRGLEHALARGDRAGEGAALVAEELALEQLGRHRAAVDDQERLVAPAAAAVDRLGGDLLAGAGLALEQDGRVAGAGLAEHVEDRLHGLRTADHATKSLATRMRVGSGCGFKPHGAAPQAERSACALRPVSHDLTIDRSPGFLDRENASLTARPAGWVRVRASARVDGELIASGVGGSTGYDVAARVAAPSKPSCGCVTTNAGMRATSGVIRPLRSNASRNPPRCR